MKKLFHSAVCLVLCATVTGGCSIFRSSTQSFEVDTDPPQAQVWINLEYAGQAPVKKVMKRDKNVDVVVKKEGYQARQMSVGSYLNSTGILDTIGAYLVILPVIGVMTPGSKSLPEKVTVKLDLMSATNAPAVPSL